MAKRIRPREAVLQMAPYHPPTGGRSDKLRLDFNENTIGCSPKVIEFLKQRLDENRLAIYPEYTEAKRELAVSSRLYFARLPVVGLRRRGPWKGAPARLLH